MSALNSSSKNEIDSLVEFLLQVPKIMQYCEFQVTTGKPIRVASISALSNEPLNKFINTSKLLAILDIESRLIESCKLVES